MNEKGRGLSVASFVITSAVIVVSFAAAYGWSQADQATTKLRVEKLESRVAAAESCAQEIKIMLIEIRGDVKMLQRVLDRHEKSTNTDTY